MAQPPLKGFISYEMAIKFRHEFEKGKTIQTRTSCARLLTIFKKY